MTVFPPEQFTDHRLCCLQHQSATTIALLAVDFDGPSIGTCWVAMLHRCISPQAVMVAQPWSRHSNSESRVWRLGSVPASAAQPQRVHSTEAAEIVTPPPKPPLCLPASASSGRLRLPACGAGAGAAAVQVCNLTAGTERRHCCRPIPGTPWGLSQCRWRDPPPEAVAGGWMSGWMDGKMGRGRVRSILQQYKS